MELKANWWDAEYSSYLIGIDACMNSTYNEQCASIEEINEFIDRNIFYVISQ